MSKFNNLDAYRLSSDDRIIELNGPEIAEIYKWFFIVQDKEAYLAETSQHVLQTLERGPLFEHHQGLIIKEKELKHLQSWVKVVKPENEISQKLILAFEAALKGEQRPDLKKIKEDEQKAAEQESLEKDKADAKKD